MAKLDIIDRSGKTAAQVELPESVFSQAANDHLIYEAVVNYRANQRQGNAATKTRAFVSGGGKKPWRQKGTGRARVGSTRSPLWRKGGTVFGPHPRDYSYELPKKARRSALRSALIKKHADQELIVTSELEVKEPKTREAVALLEGLQARFGPPRRPRRQRQPVPGGPQHPPGQGGRRGRPQHLRRPRPQVGSSSAGGRSRPSWRN